MFARMFRVVFGFVLACLAAGLTIVLFVTTPTELISASSEAGPDALTSTGMLALAAATHSAIFSAPFALIGAAFAEWRRIGSWIYYVLVGAIIAGIGFAAQYSSESSGQASIVNNYALTAFLTTGFVSGLVYWLFSGRFARGPRQEVLPPVKSQAASPAVPKAATSNT
ncbi:MAG: hypothetical protein F9K29_13185 [Hyphomicrobiaceae bacterium]|nr:MAG: hypothetical protein F9K29_13185 [Hyphomicrobiaceae bacterium]